MITLDSLSKEVTGILNDAFDELDDLVNVQWKEFDQETTCQKVREVSRLLFEHEEHIHQFCSYHQLDSDYYLMNRLSIIRKLMAEAETFFERTPLTESTFRDVMDKVNGAYGVFVERYVEYMEDWKVHLIDGRLEEYKTKFRTKPAAVLIGQKLTPSKTYLRETVLDDPPVESCGTYYRSGLHTFSRQYDEKCHPYYKKVKLEHGDQAHVGNYCNPLQLLGDSFEPGEVKMKTTPGDAVLYNRLLEYRNSRCRQICSRVRDKGGTRHIHAGFYNDYPCVMIHVKRTTILKSAHTKAPSKAVFEAWVNVLMSYYIGLVNHQASKRDIPIELERRSSFSFLSPSMAPAGESMRLSVGLIPSAYADLLADCLISLDSALDNIIRNPGRWAPVPNDIFFGSPAHKEYLAGKYPPFMPNHLFEVLWAQSEKRGKTTLQNIVRTAYASEGIAINVFNYLYRQPERTNEEALVNGLTWTVSHLKIEKGKLTFSKGNDPKYDNWFTEDCVAMPEETELWNLVLAIIQNVVRLRKPIFQEAVQGLIECHKTSNITQLYYQLELCNELIFVAAVDRPIITCCEDGYGSDSETEGMIGGTSLTARKLIVQNGMRAIWGSVIAASNYLSGEKTKSLIYLDQAYYEVPLGLEIIRSLHSLGTVEIVKKSSLASIILFDLNACITSGVNKGDYEVFENKIVILDATSSSQAAVHFHLERFVQTRASALFLAESGLKNQQMGADKNPYGTIRIFSNRRLTKKLYDDVKRFEKPIASKTSHRHRRYMKRIGAVPVTGLFFDKM